MREKYTIEKNTRPSRLAIRFLRWFCPSKLYEGIYGDLLERFDVDIKSAGDQRARRRFVWNVFRFCRPGIVLRNKFGWNVNNAIMIGNYLNVAARNIKKRKLYTFINAFGLSVGIAFCMLIYLFIEDELSFDQFHANKERIYRVEHRAYQFWNNRAEEKDRYSHSASMPVGFRQALVDELPQVELATRFNEGALSVRYGDEVMREDLAWVDPDFFKMFSFPLLAGNADKIFGSNSEVVITREIAEKYFGEEEPLGKTLVLGTDMEPFVVTGIVEPPPANSSLHFSLLLPQKARHDHDQEMDNWANFRAPTFVQLVPDATPAETMNNMDKVVLKYMGSQFDNWRKEGRVPERIRLFEFNLTPLAGVHLRKEIPWHKSSDPKYSYILSGIAILILLIACINYISLALTTSVSRRTEVGIRKVAGARKRQLILQFSFEAILLAGVSMVIGLGLMTLFLPVFNEFTGKAISLRYGSFLNLLLASSLLAVIVGILAGCYPAFIISGFRPALVLKGKFTARLQAGFTKPLVVMQFALSAFLIISSVIMYRQMKYVTTKDLGYNRDHVIVVRTQSGWNSDAERVVNQFRIRLLKEPEIVSVAGTSSSFNWGFSKSGFKVGDENKAAFVYTVDPYYIPALGIELVSGRNFSENIPSDSNAAIVNEALVKDLGWTDPLGEYINWQQNPDGRGAKVIGVVKNYHNASLEAPIEPLLLSIDTRSRHLVSMLVKVDPQNLPETLERISKTWKELYPDRIYEYTFLDEDVARQYASHQRWMRIMGLSTAFAILISCLGLFGLAGINAVNRTKEIGIRKVFGAEVMSIFVLLNRQYVWLALIAFAIAIPVSWYAMNKWLADFQFKIAIGWEIFVVSMIAGLLAALLTVSYHAIRAALVNPAETLKYE
jgi:putative ABC transport system permease protein